VALTRVLLPRGEKIEHTVDGWPAWFTRGVGRGQVVFTTLGGRAWSRPRTAADPKSPFAHTPDLPIPSAPLVVIAEAVDPPETPRSAPLDAFRAMLTEDIGYTVVGRDGVIMIFAAALVAAVALGVLLRRSRRPEWAGWLGPLAALGATAAFLVLGHSSRQTTPTVAVAQIVDAVTGKDEAALHGLVALYRSDSGRAEVSASRGGRFDLDMTGLEGQPRRFVLTDLDAWRWDNLGLPAGVRFAPFHFPARLQTPLAAVARVGPEGLVGKIVSGPWRDLADCLISAPGDRALAVHVKDDGAFAAGTNDALPPGQFVASAVLSDRQRHRQDVYRELLKRSTTRREEERNLFYAWAEPIDMGFKFAAEPRHTGSALLILPLELKRAGPGERVTVPGPLIPYGRILEDKTTRATLEAAQGADMHLRFQLPAAVLPFKLERARLMAKVDASARRVTVTGHAGEQRVELYRADSPLGPLSVDIAEERLLQLDGQGGLHLNLAISDVLETSKAGGRAAGGERWIIDFIELEVTGTTVP
jgi:hypothetical protein